MSEAGPINDAEPVSPLGPARRVLLGAGSPSRLKPRRRAGRPVRLPELKLDGIIAEGGREGEIVKVWNRLSMTSDAPHFHLILENLDKTLAGASQSAGIETRGLADANLALLVIHADHTAELWSDNLPVTMDIVLLRSVEKGEAVFHHDIGDIRAVNIGGPRLLADDKVLCVMREGWRFGFYMNLTQQFDPAEMARTLAALIRRMRYARIYNAVQQPAVFDRLVEAGWFPFAEIVSREFPNIMGALDAGWTLDDVNKEILKAFDEPRLDRMLERWIPRPHFSDAAPLLRAAIAAYKREDPVSVLKIVLTEIEGVLRRAYKAETGKSAKLKGLLAFVHETAVKKTGAPDTLLLPERFTDYLRAYVFAEFDPDAGGGLAGSRHAVGHGAAAADSYTQVRALQALLTLDQLALAT
jgi:hypothetical protein